MSQMSRRSKVYQLPDHVREQLDTLILDGQLSIDDLHAYVDEHEDVAFAPSRSSIGRYAKNFNETANALRESREMAKALAQELGPESVEGDQGRLLVEMLRSFLFKNMIPKLRNPEVEIDPMEIDRLARSFKNLAQAMHLEQDFAKRIRDDERKKLEAEVKERVSALGSAEDLKKLSDEELDKKISGLLKDEKN